MYKRRDVKWREEGSGIIIFCPIRSRLFKLNETSSLIWLEIEKAKPQEIAAKIAKDYDVSIEIAQTDVDACIEDLLANQLLLQE